MGLGLQQLRSTHRMEEKRVWSQGRENKVAKYAEVQIDSRCKAYGQTVALRYHRKSEVKGKNANVIDGRDKKEI